MPPNLPDPTPPRPGAFRSWLRGMVESLKPTESVPQKEEEILPTWDAPGLVQGSAEPSLPPAAIVSATPNTPLPASLPGIPLAVPQSVPGEGTTAAPENIEVPSAEILPPACEPPPLAREVNPLSAAVPLAEPTALAPLAIPVAEPVGSSLASIPVAEPVGSTLSAVPVAEPVPAPVPLPGFPLLEQASAPVAEPVAAQPFAAPVPTCPVCSTPRTGAGPYCDSCGFIFPPEEEADNEGKILLSASPSRGVSASPSEGIRIQGRYELLTPMGTRGNVERYRGLDHGSNVATPVPVIVVRAPASAPFEAVPVATPVPPPVAQVLSSPDETPTAEEILIGFDVAPDPSLPVTGVLDALANWPDLAWEKSVLETAQHPFLPMVLASFTEDGQEYLIEEVPSGRSLWDAWDDSDTTQEQRFVWLKHIAEQLQALHRAGALLESLRPDIVMVSSDGHGRLTDLQELLPLPLTANVTIQGTLYTAPELLACTGSADARANLYSFGAMLYALHVGRELTEMDFDRPGSPKPFIPRFPDSHPLFGRLMMKTFTREPAQRFPSDEASREDATGFTELIRTLAVCSRTLDNVRLEIAAWTTTGMVRTGNEDAFALLHACESRQDDLGEAALVLLADGMGGYEAGEVAAALAIQYLRRTLLQHPLFAPLAGASAFPTEVPRPEGNEPIQLDVEVARKLVQTALKEANRHVFTAARSGVGKRGMGCTAEVVYVNGRHVVVGHVGDSRTYHLHEGQLIQLTRDQTLVNRLVELGTLTAAEAEQHPRRNELQQAIGGQPDVEPGLYHNLMKPGDWIVVCSDGLSNHVKDRELQQMLQSEAVSAEMAARRLVNLANIEGATDNATVVVIRAT